MVTKAVLNFLPRVCDRQLFFARQQLVVAEAAEGHQVAGFCQGALLQLELGLRAYLGEISAGEAVVDPLACLRSAATGDFRVRELRKIYADQQSWVSVLLAASLSLSAHEPTPPSANQDNLIATSQVPVFHWSLLTVADLRKLCDEFTHFVASQRELASEH